MKRLTSFYSEGELSSIRVSSVEQTVDEIKNLFFTEQLAEEQIMLEVCGTNKGVFSHVDELRLDFDRIYSRKQIMKKCFLARYKFVDSANYKKEFSIMTILGIKDEQRYLHAEFRDYCVLLPGRTVLSKKEEPMLFASLRNNNYYLLNSAASLSNKPSFFKRLFSWMRRGNSSATYSK